MKRFVCLSGSALAAALAVSPALADVTPTPMGGDPHIQSVAYDPYQVVTLSVSSGFALTVLFSPDERIETVTVGDNASWNIQVNNRADALVIKPVGYAPNTNMTVLTDQRAYNFSLINGAAVFGAQPFLVRFTYPAAETELAEAAPAAITMYRISGSSELRPEEMSDDGSTTSIRWAEDAPLPAVYRDEGRGRLALLNGAMRDGVYEIEGTYDKLVFIVGKARAKAQRIKSKSRQ